jgi:hypothetical protein
VKVYGLVNVPLRRIVDVYATEQGAELALERVLANEPGWAGDVAVHALELEVQEDTVRLRSADAALIDISYREAPPTGGADAPRLLDEPKRRSPRRSTSSSC